MKENRAGIRNNSFFRRPGRRSEPYEDVEELEDAFMSEDVEDVPRDWVDDRQPMDLILQQGVDGIKQTEKKRLVIELGALRARWVKLLVQLDSLKTDTLLMKLKAKLFF